MEGMMSRILGQAKLPVGLAAVIFSALVIAACGDSDSSASPPATPTRTPTGTVTNTPTPVPTATTTSGPEAVAEQAYIFAYPMIQNYKTMYDQAVAPASPNVAVPFNGFRHKTELIGPSYTVIVRPNNDTLYSSAWLDLRAEPMVIHVPAITDRYYSFQFVDLYTFNFDYIGTRTTGTDAGNYVIAGPNWNGPTPAGINAVYRSESLYVYSLTRTAVDGQDDVPNVEAIQRDYGLQPLSAFLGQPPPSPVPSDTFPPYDEQKAQSADFIGYFNWLLGRVTIDPSEQAMIDGFGSIGIGPYLPFDSSSLDPGTLSAINAGVSSALQQIADKGKHLGTLQNGWNLPARIFGNREEMQGKYLLRAAGAYVGLYGLDLEEAYYPSTFLDWTGDPVTGILDSSKNNYVLTFPAGQLPDVQNLGFWSITMYNADQELVDNQPACVPVATAACNRYSIGNRTEGLQQPGGSLEIYLQYESPGPDKESNWLPAPNGQFSVTLRMYLPDPSAIGDPLWGPPGIRPSN